MRCEQCGARFETSTPPGLIERVRRCGVCGHCALVIEDSTRAPWAPIAGDDTPPETEQIRLGSGEHAAHFYATDAGLAARVGAYLAASLADGAVVLVIAAEAHRRNLSEHLGARGVVTGQAGDDTRAIVLDAASTLAQITVRERVNRDAFMRVLGGQLRRAGEGGRSVRAYGEMVDVLWCSGDIAGAIELEILWNELIDELGFSLLCAYHHALTAAPAHQGATDEICRLHSRVSHAAVL